MTGQDTRAVSLPKGVAILARAERDRLLAWALVGVGAVTFAVARQQLAGSTSHAEQVAYLVSGGFGALLLGVVAVTLLLAADLRDTHRKLERLEAALRGRPLAAPKNILPRLLGEGRSVAAGAAGNDRPPTSEVVRRRLGVPAVICGMFWLAGGGFLVAGWVRAAGTGDVGTALGGMVFAAVGLGLAAGGLVFFAVAAGVQRSRRLRVVLDAVGALPPASPDAGHCQAGAPDAREAVWTASGLRRFHRAGCPALNHAEGDAFVVTRPTRTLEPCLLCHPDSDGRSN